MVLIFLIMVLFVSTKRLGGVVTVMIKVAIFTTKSPISRVVKVLFQMNFIQFTSSWCNTNLKFSSSSSKLVRTYFKFSSVNIDLSETCALTNWLSSLSSLFMNWSIQRIWLWIKNWFNKVKTLNKIILKLGFWTHSWCSYVELNFLLANELKFSSVRKSYGVK